MEFFDNFLEILKTLWQENVEYILIGGFAVIIHGMPRVTQDLDIFVKMVPENIDKLKKALKAVFNDNSKGKIRSKMGLQKFKSFQEAERALWCFNPDEKYFKQVRELFKLANRLCPPNFPRGVFKYRTIEEANNAKEEWLLQNALKKRESRDKETKKKQQST